MRSASGTPGELAELESLAALYRAALMVAEAADPPPILAGRFVFHEVQNLRSRLVEVQKQADASRRVAAIAAAEGRDGRGGDRPGDRAFSGEAKRHL